MQMIIYEVKDSLLLSFEDVFLAVSDNMNQ